MKKTIIVMATFAVCVARAQTWDASDGAGLEAALAAARVAGGGEIRLAGGSYVSPSAETFAIPANVAVVGGFASDFESRDAGLYPSIVDGDGEAMSVVTVDGDNVLLDGIVITGARGTATGDGVYFVEARGLLKETAGTLTMVDCVMSNNWATGRSGVQGPAAMFSAGTVVMEGCVVADNGRFASSGAGGDFNNHANGIYATGVSLTMRQCRFSGQACEPWANRQTYGGALSLNGGTLRVTETVFEGNMAAANNSGGGAAWIQGTVDVVFSNCLFHANELSDHIAPNKPLAGWGGAIAIRGAAGPVRFFQCTFVDNKAGNGDGGALYMNSGVVTIRNSIFWGNKNTLPNFYGAEIFSEGGSLDADYLCMTSVKAP
ncbi:MAG: right-handed parallel beta-helix repeat-containing protein, partial [Kiritimatiellaeota bacterium]|nr:right-handed parallel beta-helix repeat-containing protein [Kiritimatiellota bacterium]